MDDASALWIAPQIQTAHCGILNVFGNVIALPLKGGTCAPRNALTTHCPTLVPAKGGEMLTDFTGPSGEKVTLAEPDPRGPPSRLQAVAAAAAEPSAANAAPRLSGAR